MSNVPSIRLDSQSVKQSTSTAAPAGAASSASARSCGASIGPPAGVAPCLVRGDALGHLVVPRLGGRHVDPRLRIGRDQPLGVAALAGARAAEHERQQPLPGGVTICHGSAGVDETSPEQPGQAAEQHPEQQRGEHHGDDEAVMQTLRGSASRSLPAAARRSDAAPPAARSPQGPRRASADRPRGRAPSPCKARSPPTRAGAGQALPPAWREVRAEGRALAPA